MGITLQRNLIFYNVKDYGATGDGATDDTSFIAATIAACSSGGIVFFPAGIYRISSPLVIPPNISLMGVHGTRAILSSGVANQSYIKPFASFSGIACLSLLDKEQGGYSGDNGGQRFYRLTLDGSALSGSVDGLRASGLVHDVQLENVSFNQFPHNGLSTVSYTRLDSSQVHPYSWTMINCMSFQCANIGYSFSGCTDTTLSSCQALGSGIYGFFLSNMANSHLDSCRSEFSGDKGFYITGGWGTSVGAGGMSMNGCSTDRNYKDGVYIDATGSGQIVLSSMMCRRDGSNGGSGGGGYAGFTVSSSTMPVVIGSLVVYPGQNDDGTGANSPQYGFQSSGATYVSLNAGYLHANTTGFRDGGSNALLIRGAGVAEATGTPSSPTRLTPTIVSSIKSGLAKISGGATQWGIPTAVNFSNVGTTALNVNEVRYVLMRVEYAVTLTAWQLEVTTGPAGSANIRIGLYAADTTLQPTGAPLYDSGAVAVATSFTGIKTASSLSIALPAGMYLVCINTDTAMTARTFTSGTPMIGASLGATPFIQRMSVSQSFAAFPNPGTAWTAASASAGGLQNFAVWQWTE